MIVRPTLSVCERLVTYHVSYGRRGRGVSCGEFGTELTHSSPCVIMNGRTQDLTRGGGQVERIGEGVPFWCGVVIRARMGGK